MPLRVAEGWTTLQPVGSWVLPGEPDFAESRAYQLLVRDLERYVLEEVAGRSFLIAGHRGAGKTSTVAQAIFKLNTRMIENSVNADAPPTGRRGRMQRPFAVKLIGKSLIAEPPRKEEAAAAQKRAAQPAPAQAQGQATPAQPQPPAPPPPPAANEPATDKEKENDNGQVENALVHITIALYRALAKEIAEGFAVHAGTDAGLSRPERLEMAKQLALDLDGGPDPGTLRRYWDSIGRLERGVLWPPRTDQTFRSKLILDQGMREIVAVATAAQAFQVCSGKVTYTVKSVETADREEKLDYRLDVKDLLNRLTTVGAGTLAGGAVAVQSSAAQGIGAGLLVWLLSSLVLNVSGSRARKSQHSADYQFLSDRSIQTLDRDLPLVIERIRDAGLAPVFVIDELDKLDTAVTMKQIINRLKHLVSDYGFFCFLTDRGYFDFIEKKLRDEAYPKEHTYFSQRVLVVNQSDDLFDYLVGLVRPDAGTGDEAKLPIAVFALTVIFRSRLNFSDVARKIADLANPDDSLTCSDEELQLPGQYRLAATIQLAIDEVLRVEKVAKKVAAEPGFAQLTVDALYYIARKWDTELRTTLDIRREALEEYLEGRLRDRQADAQAPAKVAGAATAASGANATAAASTTASGGSGRAAGQGGKSKPKPDPPAPLVDKDDLDLLEQMTEQLAESLCDFAGLAAILHSRGPDQWRRDEIVMTGRQGLLRRDEKGLYSFLLDEFSYDLDEDSGAAELDKGALAILQIHVDRFQAVRNLLSTIGLTLGDLARNRIIPATIQDSLLLYSQSNAELGLAHKQRTPAVRQASDFGAALRTAFDRPAVRGALILLARVRHDGAGAGPPAQVLDAIARHFVRQESSIVPPEGVDWFKTDTALDGAPNHINAFCQWYDDKQKPADPPLTIDADQRRGRWLAWRGPVLAFLESGQGRIAAPDYRDMVLAARGEPPGNLFRADLSEMTIGDWSRVVLAALKQPNGNASAPRWALFAGLTALRFDQALLGDLVRPDPSQPVREPEDGEEEEAIGRIVVRAVPADPGLLAIQSDDADLSDTPAVGEPPVLAIGRNAYHLYRDGLEWLANQGAFSGRSDEV